MFVNSLTAELKNSDVGVTLELSNETSMIVNHLIYADDLVCIAENAEDLQSLITIVNLWCCKFRLEANLTKTEIMSENLQCHNQSLRSNSELGL